MYVYIYSYITWELFRNAESQAYPRPTESDPLGVGPTTCIFDRGYCMYV